MSLGFTRKRKGESPSRLEGSGGAVGAAKTDDEYEKEASTLDVKVRCLIAFLLLFGISVVASRHISSSVAYSSSPENTKTFSSSSVTDAVLRGQHSIFTNHKNNNVDTGEEECTVWMAPSSLKGVNGYGIYTTRDLADGESILGHPDGVSVPVLNYKYTREPQSVERQAWRKVWKNYMWIRGMPSHVDYEAPGDVIDYQTGFGALPNHHCFFDVLHKRYPDPPYDDSMVDRFRDPGAGAFSYNMGREFTVEPAVEAASELFLNYGYCDRNDGRHRFPSAWGAFIFTKQDFKDAAILIDDYRNDNNNNDSQGALKFDDKDHVVLPSGIHDRVADLIPTTKAELAQLVDQTNDRQELLTRIAKSSLVERTVPWIRENGICLETILPGPSTIRQAGQGAFAKFRIPKGKIVAPAPLMQILDRKALDLFDRYTGKATGTNLIMDYCFGHPESTLMLCPNTNAALINHCSERTKECQSGGPNAEYRWSSGWDPDSDTWRNFTLDELLRQRGRGLAFEIVALREIEPGEEIFIDYGELWEKAWAAHVARWKPPSRDPSFITAKEANENTGPILDAFVSGDLRKTVDHPHLFTGCVYRVTPSDERSAYTRQRNWNELGDDELMEQYCGNGKRYMTPYNYTRHRDKTYWPCSVLKEQPDGAYIVRIHQAPWEDELIPWQANGVPRILKDYSRNLIHYFVKTGHSDQQLDGVFRHPLIIRDELFPEQWKNLK